MTWNRRIATTATAIAAAVGLSGCGFTPYDIPLPGGADTGSNPYTITAEFNDVLDLVPQSGVRVNDIAVGKVTDVRLDGWKAVVTLEINGDAKLPDDAIATIRQTSLLGEKFVSLAAPVAGGTGRLGNGDKIPLSRSGRNPELEEVFSAQSLLFNGGGLERTNTIVKELGRALDGNEPEIKEFLKTTDEFLGQLDDNKESLLTSLEQVNRLAIATDKQKGAITGALEELPDGLRVINDQRDDLVKLLQALDRLGDVATGVIRESKADTVANFKLLVPTLRNLAISVDDFAYDFKALLSYPFADGTVGGFPKALGTCSNPSRDSDTGFCVGDFTNLSIRLDADSSQIRGLLQLLGMDLSALDAAAVPAPEAGDTPPVDAGVAELQKAIEGLTLPGLGGGASKKPSSGPSSKTTDVPGATTPDGGSGDGLLCGLFGSCRTAPASIDSGSAGLATVLLQPAVAP